MEHAGRAPGFFGKIPSYGDFVGRRLPAGVRHRMDEWLQRALVQSRIDLGPAWPAIWGSSPIWRFVIGAGVFSDEAWAGVMMPSADRVGRCFPLLLAAPATSTPSLRDCLTRHDSWFARLENFALSALVEHFSIQAFDAALIASGGAPFSPDPLACASPLQPVEGRSYALVFALRAAADLPNGLADASLDWQSAWWSAGSRLVSPAVASCEGLPAPESFTALLDGCWEAHGWTSA